MDDETFAGDWAMAYRMLRNAGAAPPWIEADKEVRELLAKREVILRRAEAGALSAFARRRDREELERAGGRDQRGRGPPQRRGAHGPPAPRPARLCPTSSSAWTPSTGDERRAPARPGLGPARDARRRPRDPRRGHGCVAGDVRRDPRAGRRGAVPRGGLLARADRPADRTRRHVRRWRGRRTPVRRRCLHREPDRGRPRAHRLVLRPAGGSRPGDRHAHSSTGWSRCIPGMDISADVLIGNTLGEPFYVARGFEPGDLLDEDFGGDIMRERRWWLRAARERE